MSRELSIQNGRTALRKSDAETFRMSCGCEWTAFDKRRYVLSRIDRHFDFPDAESWETVSVIAATSATGDDR